MPSKPAPKTSPKASTKVAPKAAPKQTRAEILADIAEKTASAEKPAKPEREFRHAPPRSSRPAPAKTNGGPRVYGSDIEELQDIGRTLYAPEPWIPRLARDIGEHPRQVRRWVNGEATMPPKILRQSKLLITEQIARLNKLLVRLGDGVE